jgi:VWFA-related protein
VKDVWHVVASGVGGLATAVIVLGARPAARQVPVFSSHVQAVLVDVLVTRDRRPVAGLTAADFELRDAGVVQTVSLLDSDGLPINAVLALDMSGSTSGARLADLTAATDALLDGLRPIDRAALTTFSHVVSPRVPLTTDLSSIRRVLRTVVPDGDTAILDGVYTALMATQAETGRSLLVVCTDGRDTSSWLDADELIDSARRSNAVVDVVATGGARQWSVVRDLTDATGGQTVEVESSRQIRTEFQAILKAFRQRYVLTFVPTGVSESGFHPLDVRVRGGRATVKARPGYIAGATTTGQ